MRIRRLAKHARKRPLGANYIFTMGESETVDPSGWNDGSEEGGELREEEDTYK